MDYKRIIFRLHITGCYINQINHRVFMKLTKKIFVISLWKSSNIIAKSIAIGRCFWCKFVTLSGCYFWAFVAGSREALKDAY